MAASDGDDRGRLGRGGSVPELGAVGETLLVEGGLSHGVLALAIELEG